jgi:adenine deaminase
MQKKLLRTLLDAAKGNAAPDAIVRNGKIINVFTNEIQEGQAIAVKKGYIVDIGDEARFARSARTRIIDAAGAWLCPGFIDAHTHLDSMYPFYEVVPYSLRGGTTCLVSETGIVATACGIGALESFYDSTKGYPLRCYFLAPPLTPPFPEMERAIGLTLKEFKKVLRRKDVLGIGEAYWTRIVEGDDRVLDQAAYAIALGKTLEGHAAGAKGAKLLQYVMTGITSCHESIALDEAVEKLRMGVYVMIREGFVRRELPELAGLKDLDVDKRRIILVSDVFDGVMLSELGYLDSVVRRAIELGFTPIDAIKMATINPADYYGLRHLGAIAPLRRADILFLDNLQGVKVRDVMFDGEMVVTDGRFTGQITPYAYPEAMKHTVRAQKVTAEDFRIPAVQGKTRVRVIRVIDETITRETEATLSEKDGYLQQDVAKDIVLVAVINRNNAAQLGKGFITGTGITEGALATNITWDTGNILAVGSNEADMALAVNRLIELQGGYVIAKNGRVIHEFPMPVYGFIPDYGIPEIVEKTKMLEARMDEIGSSLPRPFLALQTIPFTGLPFLRITDKGLANIKTKQMVSLYLD